MKHVMIATMEVKPGSRGEVLQALLDNRENSLRDEPGTLQFEAIVPNDDPNTILLFEVYEDKEAFRVHFHGPNVAQFKEKVGHLMVSLKGTPGTFGTEIVGGAA